MKTVGPFVAARPLDSPAGGGPVRPVVTLHALDRLTGMPALVYLLPHFQEPPELPGSPSVLPYLEAGQQGQQAYMACELPPHAGLASDPLQTALGGLRALNALHEAGLVHGGVGPYQLWEWDGTVRLAGAGLPWGEAVGALAAPEGGSSAAADLYALGVTLLRMGPLPVGLTDLLSPYPAQRPSARDALARFNAGPPLPSEPAPLMVQAPLHPRSELHTPYESAVLPLIADPDERVSAQPASAHNHSVPIFGWDEVDVSAVPPETPDTLEPAASAQPTTPTLPTPPDAGESELLRFLAALPAEGAADQMRDAEPGPSQAVDLPPADSVTVVSPLLAGELPSTALSEATSYKAATDEEPLEIVGRTEEGAESALTADVTSQPPETQPVLSDPAVLESAEMVFSAWPAEPEDTQPASELAPVEPETGISETIILTAASPNLSKVESSVSELTELPADVSPPSEPPPEMQSLPSEPPPAVSPRQLKPVKIGWSQDGSWQVKKGDQEGGNQLAGTGSGSTVAGAPRSEDSPPPFVRSHVAASAPPGKFNLLWLVLLAVAVMLVVVLARTAFRSSSAALSASACCTVAARVVSGSGQSLSAPVRISVGSAPARSRLSAGTLIGQAPGPLALDVPGAYALKVEGDGYAAQTVKVTVPTTQPLIITLQ